MYADYLFHQTPVDLSLVNEHPGRTFVSESGLLDGYSNKTLSRSEVDQVIKETDIHFIKDEQDPKPYRHFRRYFIPASLRRLLKH